TIFDSSGGSLRNQYRQSALLREIARFGRQLNHQEFGNAMKVSWENFNRIWRNDYRTPTPEETVKFLFEYLDINYDIESLNNISKEFGESVIHYPPSVMPGCAEAIKELSQKYKLAIVSDTGFSPGSVLKRLLEIVELDVYFSAFSFSDQTGVSKPHPTAFLTALNILGVKPEEALHIGDIEATDIEGAKKIGMRAIRFSGDNTAFLNTDNPEESIADAEANSWKEIIDYLRNERRK
ncbi:MAG: putative hydrolase of the superfamily, partial [Bacteroidota bacterium]|nr:putative hydrolase of the superfamily [Bacteroidota bacterium]